MEPGVKEPWLGWPHSLVQFLLRTSRSIASMCSLRKVRFYNFTSITNFKCNRGQLLANSSQVLIESTPNCIPLYFPHLSSKLLKVFFREQAVKLIKPSERKGPHFFHSCCWASAGESCICCIFQR